MRIGFFTVIEIFLCFSYTRNWRAICISGNSHTHTHTHSSSKNTTWCIKTFKTYCRDLLLPHFGLPGFGSRISYLPRYQGDIVGLPPPGSELHITGNLKVGRVGCWTKKCWLETTDWNRESMVSQVSLWRGTWLKSNLIVSRWNTHCNINKGMLALENRNKTTKRDNLQCDFLGRHSAVIWFIHSKNQPHFFGWKLFSRVPKGAPTDPPLHFLQTDLTSWVHQWPSEMPIEPRFWAREAGC